METLPFPSLGPCKPTRSAPSRPRRHIISSFPHYFYSVPVSPATKGFSAFVALCESRLAATVAGSKTGTDEYFVFKKPQGGDDHLLMAFGNELFNDGHFPLKLPPCRQQIGDAEGGTPASTPRSPISIMVGFDPFEAAIEHIRKEDMPRHQKPSHRRARSFKVIRNLFRWKPKKSRVFPLKSAAEGESGVEDVMTEPNPCK